MRKPDVKVWRFPDGGWLVKTPEGEEVGFGDAGMLLAVAERTCDLGSRYSAQRLTIRIEPGDKHHDSHPKPCATCDCACDPDQSTPDE
jgi:hypothetical protein